MEKGNNESPDTSDNAPLCVDLDGTLIRTDSLLESVLLLVAKHPMYVLFLPLWLFHGKAYLKSRIADKVIPNPQLLPYNEEVLAYIRQKKLGGTQVVLVTAAHQKIAEAISKHLGLFELVSGSSESLNLKGECKADYLTQAFGARGFDYIGDSCSDMPVWEKSRNALVAGTSRSVAPRLRQSRIEFETISGKTGALSLMDIAKALRLHQWLKNLLIFIPLITSLSIFQLDLLSNGLIAFVAFGLTASAIYIINDLLDLESDRKHPRKKYRPFASGTISILRGIVFAPMLAVVSFILAANFLPILFSAVLLLYLVITIAYSLFLKRIVLVDVITLAGLYTIRIVSGGFAMDIELSFWLLTFSMFIFLSLAIIKRYSELQEVFRTGGEWVAGRGYKSSDRYLLMSMGIATGYISVLVFAFYINSPAISQLYTSPKYLWLLCPLLLYWVSRMWMQAERENIHDDPVIFAAKDRITYIIIILGAIFMYLATVGSNNGGVA